MIATEGQLDVTKRAIGAFEEALTSRPRSDGGSTLERAVSSSIEAQLRDLRDEVAEWYRLRSGEVSVISVERWCDLPKALIRARLARRLSQEDLAGLVGAPVSDIARFEETEYEALHFARVIEIADALGVTFSGKATLAEASREVTSPGTL